MAATNRDFDMQSIHETTEHPYDHLDLTRGNFTASPATNQICPAVANNRRQPTENIGISRRMLFLVIAVLTISSLATVTTLIVTITMMKSENAPTTPTALIAATRGNQEKCVFREMKQQLIELKEEIRTLKENLTSARVFDRGDQEKCVVREMKQQLIELKKEIRTLKENLTSARVFDRGLNSVYKNCAHVYQSGSKISGVYEIDPDGLGVFEAYCDQETAGGGWTVVQKRLDGSVDFYKGWDAYKRGFGYLNGEFWLGLDKIHRLTENGNNKLRIDLELHKEAAFAEYNFFAVENETEKYKLYVGGYSGNVGDSLTYHRYQAFTTKDRDNDALLSENCAVKDQGAWWYKDCYQANLNGLYLNGSISGQGIIWFSWKNDYVSVTRSEMKIRPKEF